MWWIIKFSALHLCCCCHTRLVLWFCLADVSMGRSDISFCLRCMTVSIRRRTEHVSHINIASRVCNTMQIRHFSSDVKQVMYTLFMDVVCADMIQIKSCWKSYVVLFWWLMYYMPGSTVHIRHSKCVAYWVEYAKYAWPCLHRYPIMHEKILSCIRIRAPL